MRYLNGYEMGYLLQPLLQALGHPTKIAVNTMATINVSPGYLHGCAQVINRVLPAEHGIDGFAEIWNEKRTLRDSYRTGLSCFKHIKYHPQLQGD